VPVNSEVLVDWKNTESPAGFIYIYINQPAISLTIKTKLMLRNVVPYIHCLQYDWTVIERQPEVTRYGMLLDSALPNLHSKMAI